MSATIAAEDPIIRMTLASDDPRDPKPRRSLASDHSERLDCDWREILNSRFRVQCRQHLPCGTGLIPQPMALHVL